MKVINEKGKLFGKINVIDFLVILFFTFMLPAGYFGFKILTTKPPFVEEPKEFVEIETDFKLT